MKAARANKKGESIRIPAYGLVFLMLIFLGCQGPVAESPQGGPSRAPQKAKAASAGPEEGKEVGIAGQYSYNPAGRPDPFKPFISEEKIKTALPGGGGAPLQSLEVGQLKLMAVITGGREPFAMAEDASGKGYILHMGSRVGIQEGVVTSISGNKVVVTEKVKDFGGKTRTRTVTLELSKGEH